MSEDLLKMTTEVITNNYATQAVGSELSQFYKFMVDNNVIQIGVAFIISNQVTSVFGSLMKDIISPIVARLIGSDEKKLENHKLIILGMHFDIGSFILSLFNFWLILVIVFYLVRALPKETVSKK